MEPRLHRTSGKVSEIRDASPLGHAIVPDRNHDCVLHHHHCSRHPFRWYDTRRKTSRRWHLSKYQDEAERCQMRDGTSPQCGQPPPFQSGGALIFLCRFRIYSRCAFTPELTTGIGPQSPKFSQPGQEGNFLIWPMPSFGRVGQRIDNCILAQRSRSIARYTMSSGPFVPCLHCSDFCRHNCYSKHPFHSLWRACIAFLHRC